MYDGLRLALTTLTVAPVRPGRVDRTTAATAMSLAPAVGVLIGLVQAAVLLALREADAPGLLAGVVVVAVGVGLTRGLHLDGLADTADALGSYRDPAGALEIMRRSDVGPFGVIALVLVLLAQVAAVAVVPPAAVVAAAATGRLGISWGCRRDIPAARPDGLGALVAGTVGWPALVAGTALVGVLSLTIGPFQGPLAVALGLVAALAVVRHAVRRFGGITGDVLGAACETATTVALAALAFR